MRLKTLELENFRNYSKLKIDFFDGINVFYGENAQGKTNILEACYLFSSARSHRNAKDREMINFEAESASLVLDFFSQNREQQAQLKLFSGKNKKLFINNIEQKTKKALLGVFNTVIFSPEDLFLIKEGPENRRRFMDTDIAQLRPNYFSSLSEYRKVCELKNNLLKTDNPDRTLIGIYNEKLARAGANINIHRRQFIEMLNELSAKASKYISDGAEETQIVYAPDSIDECVLDKKEIYNSYISLYNSNTDNEIYRHCCLFGVHKDDVKFYINSKEAKAYASQGQQRCAVLSLKLAEYEFMRSVLGEPPILLLDDILSELDLKRQDKLLNFIRDNQTVITCTDKDLYKAFKYPYKLFYVKDATVK